MYKTNHYYFPTLFFSAFLFLFFCPYLKPIKESITPAPPSVISLLYWHIPSPVPSLGHATTETNITIIARKEIICIHLFLTELHNNIYTQRNFLSFLWMRKAVMFYHIPILIQKCEFWGYYQLSWVESHIIYRCLIIKHANSCVSIFLIQNACWK